MRYLERLLYEYKTNIAIIENLKFELKNLSSLHGQSYEVLSRNFGVDPVALRTVQVIAIESRLEKLGKKTRPVKALSEHLKSESRRHERLSQILENRYFKHKTWREIENKLDLSERTLMRLNYELIKLFRKFME